LILAIKRSWLRIDGVLLLDKPSGMTSNAALQAARRLFLAAKAGHTGTLDPLATGLLPLCFGDATKFSADLLESDKTYEADLLFGVTTDTGDAEGAILERRPVNFNRDDLEALLPRFRGLIRQIPPMYSALKRNGRPLYELARKGIEVEREAREVSIHELVVLDLDGDCCRLLVSCSKGTYIRTLAEDIGTALNSGAHLTGLRRITVGSLNVADALTLEELDSLSDAERKACLQPPDALLQTLPVVHLDAESTVRFMHGNAVPVSSILPSAGRCRVYGSDGCLLGLADADATGQVHPRRLVCA
jgi:tRNA pseudouridine55 synthase